MQEKNQTFAVLGLSRFGHQAAVSLFRLGADVVAVDRSENEIQKVASKVSKAVQGDVLDWDVLEHAGIPHADVVIIGLRSAFDATVLLVHHLRSDTKVKKIIALADTREKKEVLEIIGVDEVIFPEHDTADRLVKQLRVPNLVDQLTVSADMTLIEIDCPQEFVGYDLKELKIQTNFHVNVIGVIRPKRGRVKSRAIIAPHADLTFQADDKILCLGNPEYIIKFSEAFSGLGDK